jgi:hypothetical protein
MGVFSGPDIRENGLILALDAGNTKSYGNRENLVSYSTYNASTWSKIETTGTGTLTTGIDAPDGSTNAIRITFNNNGNILLRVTFPAFTPNGTDTYTTSFYVRKISGTGNVSTDLSDGNPGGDYSSRLITNQWVRITTSAVPTATSKSFIDLISDTNTNYVLDFWGLQVEKSTSVTNYTATNGSTISRATTFTDLSGNGNNGTLTNGPSYDGFNSGSILFDGTDDYINIAYNASLKPATAITMESFCYIQNNGTGWASLIQYPQNSSSHTDPYFDWAIYLNMSSRLLHTRIDGEGASSPNNVWNFNEWVYVAITFENQSVKYYVNGVSVGSSSISKTSITYDANNPVLIGKNASGGEPFEGKLGSIKVYNRALTAAEIQQNFNANRGRFGI